MVSITEEKFLNSPKKIIDEVRSSNDILNVIAENSEYVIIDADEWRSISETIYLNSIKGLSASIIEASKEPLETATPLEKLDWSCI